MIFKIISPAFSEYYRNILTKRLKLLIIISDHKRKVRELSILNLRMRRKELIPMQNLKNFIIEKIKVPMTTERESGYASTCAERILRYDKFFLFLIIGIQLYNILYVLLYTKGTLHSVSSRVYTVLYTILLFVSLGLLFLIIYFKKRPMINAGKVIAFQLIYGTFILLWGACITVYDHRVSENFSVYFIISLSVAILVYYKPLQSILVYAALEVFLILLIPLFKDQTDRYGEILNLTIMTLTCIFISLYRNSYDRKHYLYQQTIIEKNAQLQYIANNDTLTGLKNRRFLEEEMDSLYKRCFEGKTPITFMMLDIDSFKNYNDSFGHAQGDECLRRVSWRLQSELDEEREYLIRYGGEEFLYVGVGIDEATAKNKGLHFNKIVRDLVIGPSDREPMGITVSIGTYTVLWNESAKYREWRDCVNEADKALYRAKNSGKDRCVFSAEPPSRLP